MTAREEVEHYISWTGRNPDAYEVLNLSHDWGSKRGLSLREALVRYPEAAKEALRRMRVAAVSYLEEMRELIESDDFSELNHHAGHVWSEMNAIERLIKAHWANLRGEPEEQEPTGEVGHEQARVILSRIEVPGWPTKVREYISQQEARQRQAERERGAVDEYRHELCGLLELDADASWSHVVADVHETVAHVAHGDEQIGKLEATLQSKDDVITELRDDILERDDSISHLRHWLESAKAERAELSQKLEAAERDVEFYKDCLDAAGRNARTIIEQRDELKRKLRGET